MPSIGHSYAQFSNFIWAVEKYGNVISYFFRTVGFAILVLGRWLNAFGATLSHCAGRDTSYNANLPTLSSPAPPILWPPVTSSEAQETNKFAKILPEQVFQSLY